MHQSSTSLLKTILELLAYIEMEGLQMINIIDYLNDKKFKSKEQLMEETGLSERNVRQKISDLKRTRVVIYNSQTKGYRLAKFIDPKKMTPEEIDTELELVNHSINDIKARKNVFNKQLRKYIAYTKKVEQVRNGG
jgi:biotin operon repressor